MQSNHNNSANLDAATAQGQGTPMDQARPNLVAPYNLEITQVSITPVSGENGSKLKAFVQIVLNGVFVVKGIRIVHGKSGPFVAFPRQYDPKSQTGYDTCFPISGSVRSYMTAKILNHFSAVNVGDSQA